ncbi:MAG: phage terminase small subunit P27 family [Devosia sp.]
MKGAKPRLVVDNDPVTKAPAAPSWLSADAKKEWRRIMPVLLKRKILTTADLGSLENYCLCIGTIREMERNLQRQGHIIEVFKENTDGDLVSLGVKRNPAVSVQADAMTRARLLAAELGLTPVSRSRPAIREDEDDDDLNPLDVS